MNKIEELQVELANRFVGINFKMTRPRNPDGQWTLDVMYQSRWLVVEWRAVQGFGISIIDDETMYGEGPDEVHPNYNEALERIEALLTA
jgi:hypothetical protein